MKRPVSNVGDVTGHVSQFESRTRQIDEQLSWSLDWLNCEGRNSCHIAARNILTLTRHLFRAKLLCSSDVCI